MAASSKFFRIALEGATTDGRTIKRDWIAQMAKNYNPELYGARINIEHYRSVVPDSVFRAYGDVIALKVQEETDGDMKGKLALYAQLDPTDDLVAMTKARQKIYTSCEIQPEFSDLKEAYLVGLAVTDSPASLGTQVLTFAAENKDANPFAGRKQSPDNLFTAAMETPLNFDDEPEMTTTTNTQQDNKTSLFASVKELLGMQKKETEKADANFTDITKAIEALAQHGKGNSEAIEALTKKVDDFIAKLGNVDAVQGFADEKNDTAALKADLEKHIAAFNEMKVKLESTDKGNPSRPAATGTTGEAVLTDC